MLKPNRLVYKLEAAGTTLESASKTLSGGADIIGKFEQRLEAGVDQAVLGTAEAIGRTGYEAIRKPIKLTRKLLKNTLGPIAALKGDEGIMKKTGKALVSLPKDVLWGNVRDVVKGTVSLAGTVAGAKIEGKKLKFRKGIGAAGVVANMAGGTWKVATSPLGQETANREEEEKANDEEMKATIDASME